MAKFSILTLVTAGLIIITAFIYNASLDNKNAEVIVDKPKELSVLEPTVPVENKQVQTTKLSLQEIFDNKIEKSEESIILAATGDFIPARSVNYLATQKNNFTWTVYNTKSLFDNADAVLVSLETPLIKDCPLTNEGFTFCGDLRHIEALKLINTTVVNLANNHSHNFGEDGIEQTVKALKESNIKYSGIYEENNIVEIQGLKLGFLGYNNIGANPHPVKPANKDLIEKEIKALKEKVDIVVVSFSWGIEYTTEITQTQKELAYFAIDSGADLIIGNHPHIIQPVEIYKNKLITYAHGNYVFDQEWSTQTKQGVIGFYQFNKKGLVQADFKPIYIQNYGEAAVPTKDMSEEILKTLQDISYSFAYSN